MLWPCQSSSPKRARRKTWTTSWSSWSWGSCCGWQSHLVFAFWTSLIVMKIVWVAAKFDQSKDTWWSLCSTKCFTLISQNTRKKENFIAFLPGVLKKKEQFGSHIVEGWQECWLSIEWCASAVVCNFHSIARVTQVDKEQQRCCQSWRELAVLVALFTGPYVSGWVQDFVRRFVLEAGFLNLFGSAVGFHLTVTLCKEIWDILF